MSGAGNKPLSFFIIVTIGALLIGALYLIFKIVTFYLPEKKVTIVRSFCFDSEDALKGWDQKVLRKKVLYRVESHDGESFVRAISKNSCSGLYHKVKIDVSKRPFISWRWRVAEFPDKDSPDDLTNAGEDDFAARVYVIFPALFFANTKVLEYVWAEDLAPGTMSSSPYTDNIKLVVVESGLKDSDVWVEEERDICEDYVAAFDKSPNMNIGSVAFMCDSDSTGTSAEAFFDDIKIYFKER